jgi:arsenite methyltransferase
MERTAEQIKTAVQERYGSIARGERSGCGCASMADVAVAIGYSAQDLELAEGANLGLGCGNPLALAELQPGMTVLDLGSGAGFDAFLAWRQVGPSGRVIGVDMTDDMLARARANAKQLGATNVEFRKGIIEALPVEDASVDFIISNCVINLSTNKPAVFAEMFRVLKPGGRFAVSDIVLLKELPERIAQDVGAYVGCIAGASLMGDYIRLALEAGLADLTVPQILYGGKAAAVLAPPTEGKSSCCGTSSDLFALATSALASIKLHGRKA